MKKSVKNLIKGVVFAIPFLLCTMTLSAQDTTSYEKAKAEIQEQFGTFPSFLAAYPQYALPGAWESYKQINGPDSLIPPMYRELIQLAVASQIPCEYCVYFHKASAIANGASDEEVKEAIAHGAQTRHWSMLIQGAEVQIEDFKTEFDGIMDYMNEKSKE